MSTEEASTSSAIGGPELQQMLQAIVQDALRGAIGAVQQGLEDVSLKLSRVESQLREQGLQGESRDQGIKGLNAKLSRVERQLDEQADQDQRREQGFQEVRSSLTRLERQMLGVRGRLSDLDSRQRTGQLIGRFVPPPYVPDMAQTNAPFSGQEQDRSPMSPYAQ